MTPDKWQKVQSWYDGVGSDAERREVEQWIDTALSTIPPQPLHDTAR